MENMNPATVLDIGIISSESSYGYYFFLPFVLRDVNGKQYNFTESGLNNAFLFNEINGWLRLMNHYGPLEELRNPNFILCSVRYNSENGMYRIR